MDKKNYWISTALTLQVNETLSLIELKAQGLSLDEIKNKVLIDNFLQKEKLTTIKRQMADYLKRLKYIDDDYINLIFKLDYQNKKYFLFSNLLETYPMLFDFMTEVISHKISVLDYFLNDSDFFNFLSEKESEIPNTSFSEKSRYKLKQVTYRILTQADLLDKNKKIIEPLICHEIIEYFLRKNKKNYLKALLVSDI
jgi:hypothetical protein